MLYVYFISSANGINFKKLRAIKNKYGREISGKEKIHYEQLNERYKEEVKKQRKRDTKATT